MLPLLRALLVWACVLCAAAALRRAAAQDALQVVEIAVLSDPNGQPKDSFGIASSVSPDGSTVAIGSSANDAAASGAGAVFVFFEGPSGFELQQEIAPDDVEVNDGCGWGVAVHGDTLAFGCIGHGPSSNGAIYIYFRTGSTWAFSQKILGLNGRSMGNMLAFDDSGNVLVAGGPGLATSGYAASYERASASASFSTERAMFGNGLSTGSRHGGAVAISDDGLTAAVGASADDHNGVRSGTAHVYVRNAVGDNWARTTVRPDDGAESRDFGISVAVCGVPTGTRRLVVSARTDVYSQSGAVYDFSRAANESAWTQRQKLSSGRTSDQFGNDVALSRDCSVLFVGAYNHIVAEPSPSSPGGVFVYRRNVDDTAWALVDPLILPSDTSSNFANFGQSIGLAMPSASGRMVVGENQGSGVLAASGSAYVYTVGPFCDAARVDTTLDSSGISGTLLQMSVLTDVNLESASVTFAPGAGARPVTASACGGAAVWVPAAEDCATRHSFSEDLADTLEACGFEGPTADPARGTFYYEALVEVTTVRNESVVFGSEANRTDVTSFRVRVESVDGVNVTAGPADAVPSFPGLVAEGRTLAVLTTQEFNTTTETATLRLRTAVAWPYQLVAVSLTEPSAAGTWDELNVTKKSGTCPGESVCDQDWDLTLEAGAGQCDLDGTYLVSFNVTCNALFTGSCDAEAATQTASVEITLDSDDFCPQVVEVASITPELTTYAGSAGGTVSTNYILETTLFGRVTALLEAGLLAKRTTLTGLDIVSSCTGCLDDTVQPFTDGLSAAATAYDFLWEDGGRVSTAAGEVQTDFSFTLNTNSLSFDNDATTGEAQITLTAFVSVEYDTPSAQGLERSYRAQAVSGPGSVGSSASANFGVSGTPAGGTTGGSSSTAGSTVLGVSTGTAALAAVGLAAVAAVAFGAAVAAKRRRTPLSLKHTSSSLELNDTASVQA